MALEIPKGPGTLWGLTFISKLATLSGVKEGNLEHLAVGGVGFGELMFVLPEGPLWQEGVGQLLSLLVIGGCRGTVWFFECWYLLLSVVCGVHLHVPVDGPYILPTSSAKNN